MFFSVLSEIYLMFCKTKTSQVVDCDTYTELNIVCWLFDRYCEMIVAP